MNNYTKKCQLRIRKESIRKLDISDEEYFSEKYARYVSNSKLKLINPDEGGSPELFFGESPKLETSSLAFGSAIHELILQPEEFHLSDYEYMPSEKMAKLVREVRKNRNGGMRIYDAIKAATKELNYMQRYKPQTILRKCPETILHYYYDFVNFNDPATIILPNDMKYEVERCMESYERSSLKPFLHMDDFFDPMEYHNEQAIICDIEIELPDGEEIIIPFKLKIDNYRVNKTRLVLNDLKTTGKDVNHFKNYEEWNYELCKPEAKQGSYYNYHYYRQLACYLEILRASFDRELECEANILAIESNYPHKTNIFRATPEELAQGMEEFKELMCRIADYIIHGREYPTEYDERDF